MEVYLHQLSARLLGWRRSCDPPAIELELPAGNNQSHCYAGADLYQLKSWPENYPIWPLEEVDRESEVKANKLEAAIMDRKRNSYFHAETISYILPSAKAASYLLFVEIDKPHKSKLKKSNKIIRWHILLLSLFLKLTVTVSNLGTKGYVMEASNAAPCMRVCVWIQFLFCAPHNKCKLDLLTCREML